jgi:prolyl oligopeptidase
MIKPAYPPTHKVNQVDSYHGVQIQDPFRWLEDDTSPERITWIAAQNRLTQEYLSTIPGRDELRCRFEHLLRYPRHYDLVRRGPDIVFKKNNGLQDQLSLCVQRGLTGTLQVLVDPTELAPDGTIGVVVGLPSKDMRYLAYGLSNGGADWQEYFVKDLITGQDLPDRLRWVKTTAIAWRGHGFYYSRFPEPVDIARSLSAPNENHQVWYHSVNAPQATDTLVYEDREHPHRFHFVESTEDERFTTLSILDAGAGHDGNALWVLAPDSGVHDFAPVVASFGDTFRAVDAQDDCLLVLTNRRAPNWRLVLINLKRPGEGHWKEIIPEGDCQLESVTAAGGKLLVIYRRDAAHRLYVFDRSGGCENEIRLPGPGFAHVIPGQRDERDVLWSFTSFTVPTTIYRYDTATRASQVFWMPEVRFSAGDFETKQVFCRSRDGTQVPMFIVHRKDLSLNGRHGAFLEGYGGNGSSVGPSFDPLRIALLECGVVYAIACLRGGGEYGVTWHRAGWREKKQNVFDDCIAAAEWLQANGYTSRDRCALIGASNGGLLVGAVMTQRPDLFKVALPGGGVLDMLRFQKFTIGWSWTAEYGSSDDPAMFPILLAYSPLHNIKEGVSYPATMVTTSEHDDRVVPAHSFKFIASLQANAAGPNPYLIRIDSNSGHSPVNLPKAIDERADVYAFMLAHLAEVDEPGKAGVFLPS